ncbi:MAG: FG-GAP repeat domain-containing protein, partial [Terrimicrobiaceae bacterium]
GYLRIFFNSGTPQEPKFTSGELGGIFLTRTDRRDPILGGAAQAAENARMAPRLFATDILKSGKKDLIIGNYIGEILLVPNGGSAQAPDFKQPATMGSVTIPTMKDSNKRWGNVFAPATWDWNKDGKDDLLLGEGSYSANNIHVLLNMGAGAKPTFDEENRSVLAFGDGLEQLTPAVVDYNGDGQPDLLVAERTGKIAVYLNKGVQPKLGERPAEVPFASFISGGSSPLSFGGISTVTTGDLNGDGLFDLVVGKTNGRIASVLNTGSKTEPKFGAPVELKGDAGTPPLAVPSGWDVDYGLKRGNFYGYVTVVKDADDKNALPPEGLGCLKAGYFPSTNKYMPAPANFSQGFPGFDLKTPNFWGTSEQILSGAPARYFMLRQLGRFRLKTNTNYTLTFKVKGRANDGVVFLGWTGFKKLSEAKVVRGERGSATVQTNEAREEQFDTIRFSAGPQWAEVKKDFRVVLKDKELQDLKEATSSLLQLSFTLPPGGEVYFDDVRLVERP